MYGEGLAALEGYRYAVMLHQQVRDAERRLTGAPRTRWHGGLEDDGEDWGCDPPEPSFALQPDMPRASLARLAVLSALLGARARRAEWAALWAAMLMLLAAIGELACPPLPPAPLAPDHRPASDLSPTVAAVRAHALLTAAPPASRARIPAREGAAA